MKCVSLIHEYLDGCYKSAETDQQRVDTEKVRGMSVAYCVYYEDDGYETCAIEEPFDLPILSAETGADTGMTYNGIQDCILRRTSDGKLFGCDHKTASQVNDSYWAELKTNPQLSRYVIAAMQKGVKFDGFLWDVIQKPGISPVKLTKKAVTELEEGSYCGMPWKLGYNGEERETPRMYGQRVLSEYLNNPKRYFHRRPVYRTPEELLEYLGEFNHVTADMQSVKGCHEKCYRNLYACKSFGRLCDFHPICCGDDAGKGRYQPRKGQDDDAEFKFSEGSLSNSQVSTFQRCRREWHYRYVEKIEPMKAEYSDALYIGTMLHKCLEFFLEEKRGDERISLK